MWRAAADVVVGTHFAFLGYVLLGGFVAWRWPRTIFVHVVAVIWGALIIITKVPCPLTALQNWFLTQGDLPRVPGGFIGTYVKGTLYPAHLERLAQAIVALVVLASWIGYRTRRRNRIAV